ncbi:hypothetical protein [Massilia sp. S19_KUP03_FR1]|uniref:hypothetical protein n=1 Tax=Massilia sp. S19_KUP03_FR1 TaxID=3025503 RepID=UPI002FCD68A8
MPWKNSASTIHGNAADTAVHGIEGSGAATSFGHGGHNRGYSDLIVAYSGRGDGAVVMTNGDNGDEIARALAGKYAIKDLGDFDITYKNGKLLFWIPDKKMPTIPARNDRHAAGCGPSLTTRWF